MPYNLFLDDVRHPNEVSWVKSVNYSDPSWDWQVVRSYPAFVKMITENGLPGFISFDHDLAWDHYPAAVPGHELDEQIPYDQYKERTGYHCAQWLVDFCLTNKLRLPKYAVHSLNPVGKKNIERLFENFERVRLG